MQYSLQIQVREVDKTYEYLKYFSDWLVSKGFPAITVVQYKTKKGKRVSLEDEIIAAKTLPSVAFGYKNMLPKTQDIPATGCHAPRSLRVARKAILSYLDLYFCAS